MFLYFMVLVLGLLGRVFLYLYFETLDCLFFVDTNDENLFLFRSVGLV